MYIKVVIIVWTLVTGNKNYEYSDKSYSQAKKNDDPSKSTTQTEHAGLAEVFSSCDPSLLHILLSLHKDIHRVRIITVTVIFIRSGSSFRKRFLPRKFPTF